MDHIKNIKIRFALEIRTYLRENMDDDLIAQVIRHQREIVPDMVRSGLDQSEITEALSAGPAEVRRVLEDYAHSRKSWSALAELSRDEVEHPLIRLKDSVKRMFLVGSMASGNQHAESDIDILIEVRAKKGLSALELAEKYRRPLQQYFVTHNIRGKDDSVHPQFRGKRIDLYFTYDADAETRPKIELK